MHKAPTRPKVSDKPEKWEKYDKDMVEYNKNNKKKNDIMKKYKK